MEEPILINDCKMFLDPTDTLELKSKGKFEKFETELVKKEVKEGDIVLDVGANIGYYTLIFSKAVGRRGKVFAFEPEPNNFILLQKNVQINNLENVTLIQKAVSKKSGKIYLYLCDYNHGQHRTYESPRCNSSISVDCITIDDYVESASLNKINFIKMDVKDPNPM